MKWTIAGLIFVGLIAAISASILAVTLRVDTGVGKLGDANAEEVEVLVATRALPAMTMVDSTAVAKEKVKRSEMPPQAMTNSTQVIGRVLRAPVLAGQAFAGSQFASNDSGLQMASAIPQGSRAVSVMLSDDTGIENLLYPGSIIDVVATIRLPAIGGNQSAESVSVTLLQGLQVLAVGGRTIMSDDAKLGDSADASGRRGRMVTLMVNTSQAEALQLAANNGKIAVSLRNPLDMEKEQITGTRISDLSKDLADRIAQLAESEIGAMPLVPPEMPRNAEQQQPALGAMSNASNGNGNGGASGAGGQSTSPAVTPTMPTTLPPKPDKQWLITILRGSSKEVQRFPMSKEETQH